MMRDVRDAGAEAVGDVGNAGAVRLEQKAKDAPIAVYCHSGNRAGQAAVILRRNGFTHVSNAGGLAGLSAQGLKTCAGTSPSC